MSVPATVFVVDDDVTTRSLVMRLAERMGHEARGYDSAEQFLNEFDPEATGCIILDLQMSGMSGLDLQARLVEQKVTLPIIICTAHGDIASAVRAMKLHAMDFVQKPVDPEALRRLIERAVQSDASQRPHAQRRRAVAQRLPLLSPREREVMQLVVNGLANKQIARALKLSEKTIEVHRGNVMRKMEADSVAELVRMSLMAEENGSHALR
jgi:two-component system, LuxR family, response regulator FixJ